MTIAVKETAYEAGEAKVRFLEVAAVKKDNLWEYSQTGPWFRNQSIGALYEEFSDKAKALKESGQLAELDTILCNAAYAVELFVNGIITKAMIDSIEQKVAGAGRGMIPMVCIPKQDFMLEGMLLEKTAIVIVDCHSYERFCFIDRENRNM